MGEEKQERFPQGIWDYFAFDKYLMEWLIPRTLGDLETLFYGATERCERVGGARGNFVLATALFSVMDHVGAFLREPSEFNSASTNWQNISWCAGRLPSTEDVPMFMAFAGRNALVHGAWPQTMIIIQDKDGSKRVGFNVAAEADITKQHRYLYRKPYPEPLDDRRIDVDVVKLRLNVYALFAELGDLLKSGNLNVSHEVFLSVRRQMSELAYFELDTDLTSSEKIDRIKDSERDKSRKAHRGKIHWREQLLLEIRYLHEELRGLENKFLPIRRR